MTAAPEGGTPHLHTHTLTLTSLVLMLFLRLHVDRRCKQSLIMPVEKNCCGKRGKKKQQLFIYLQAVVWWLIFGPHGEAYNMIDGQKEGKEKQ